MDTTSLHPHFLGWDYWYSIPSLLAFPEFHSVPARLRDKARPGINCQAVPKWGRFGPLALTPSTADSIQGTMTDALFVLLRSLPTISFSVLARFLSGDVSVAYAIRHTVPDHPDRFECHNRQCTRAPVLPERAHRQPRPEGYSPLCLMMT